MNSSFHGVSDDLRVIARVDPRDVTQAAEGATGRARRRLLPRGTVLGGEFEVRELIGEGGMGQVYEAQDRLLNRRVAVKVGWPDLASSVLVEAQALAALRHPGVVAIHSVGRHADMDYVVMELIRGPTLEDHMRRQRSRRSPFAVMEAVELLVGIAESLGAVHRAGMAHRDVKPANIILAPGDRVVLTDFGIFQPEIYAASGLSPAGSPPYMAPETIRKTVRPGEAYLVDTYALGVVAFELLTGDTPFPIDNVRLVFWMHLMQDPPEPRAHRSEVPIRLSALVREMLAKDPRARPQSMEEVTWTLRRVRGADPLAPQSCYFRSPNSG
jgi:serine/threonine protein kinase